MAAMQDPSQIDQPYGDVTPFYPQPQVDANGNPINQKMADPLMMPGENPTDQQPATPTIDDGPPPAAKSATTDNGKGQEPPTVQGKPVFYGPYTGMPTGSGADTSNKGGSSLDDLLASLIASRNADSANATQQRQNLQDTLNRVISSAEKPVSADQPEIAGPTGAFWAQGQRARSLLQEQLAQEANASGKTTGSVDSAVKTSFEDLGNATGSYQGNLMVNELQARRAQLQGALTTGATMLSGQDQARLTEELRAIDARIADTGQKNQNNQFYDRLSSDMGQHASDLDTILATLVAQGGGSLAA